MNSVKRIFYAFSIIILVAGFAAAQQKPKTNDAQNLYIRALSEILPASGSETIEHDFHLNSNFPTRINSSVVNYLDADALIEKYKKEKNTFRIIRMFPMRNEENKIIISFNYYWFSYKKKILNYALEGGTKVTFKYDCGKNEFILDNKETWGV